MPPDEGDSTTTTPAGLTGRNTASSGNGIGVLGTSTNGEGVHGETNATNLSAVAGIELNPSSNAAAVYGEQRGNGAALFGNAKGSGPGVFATSANGEGVHGETNATNLSAVTGIELNPSSNAAAVYGEQRGSGSALFGVAKGSGPGVFATSANGEGVHGETNATNLSAVTGIELNPSSNAAAVYGEQRGSGSALFGVAKGSGPGVFATSANGEGVHGETNATNLSAVTGIELNPSSNAAAVYGEQRGSGSALFGVAKGSGPGVFAISSLGTGVHGESSGGGLAGIGVAGISKTSSGVAATSANITTPSILGRHTLPGGVGVVGYNPATTGDGVGVFGKADSTQRGDQPAIGVWGYCPQGLAGVFSGDVLANQDMTVTGTFAAATKLFKIDHPLDPANRYLVHASLESSEMINVYSGNVTTDAAGESMVSLPGYFQAINSDFRYQLTVIGQFAQAIVANEIQNNRFAIKTDRPNVKVSWQVTGLRQDNYAKAHSLIAEQEKSPSERGLFLHPELFNEPEEKGLGIPKSRSASIALNYDIK